MSGTPRTRRPVEKNWLEWTVFGLGVVLLAALLAYLLVDLATGKDPPPDIVVVPGGAESTAAGFRIPVEVRNRGGTATEVEVEVVLQGVDGVVERAGFALPRLPAQSTHSGWVILANDPRAGGRLVGRPVGFQQP